MADSTAVKIDQKGSSKMHRFQVGDVVAFEDSSEWPPVHMEGPIMAFTNAEMTYLECELSNSDGKTIVKELTEDEVKRVA